MDGAAGATSAMPRLISAVERAKRISNSVADLADQLHTQADRVLGSRPPEPQSPSDGAILGKPEGGPAMQQLDAVLSTLERNLAKAAAGANRMNELG